jgi:N-acetylglucosaminyldiphosphoundecaprenol N-acetyl-beta-D-mannosaminyltransferase
VGIEAFERVHLDGTGIDRITEAEVVAIVRDALTRGRGGRIVTPNIDILRRAQREPEARRYLDEADLVVADGMPLIWASKLGGSPLPERVAGSSLIWSLSAGVGRDRRSIFVIGGAPSRRSSGCGQSANEDETDGATRAADRLAATCPGLRVAGALCPPYGFERDRNAVADLCTKVSGAEPDLVFVGLGFPKQERIVDLLRPELPNAWFVGCGAAVNFVAGDVDRAPRWMQRTGLEWAHRLGTEPGRLAGRYLRHDAPYALRLLARAPAQRARTK